MRKVSRPITNIESVKGHNIREKGAAPEKEPTRNIMKDKVWKERNTKGNPKKSK